MAVPDEVEAAPPQISAQPDVLWAAAVGVIAVAVYVRTLAPGMIPVSDTPALQFVGRVLGVAHNPGYPTYVLLTYPFSYLPVGSLAYRINLFSALLGGLTAALTYLIARRLGCRIVISLSTGLALAFGHEYWSQAVIAEVYTLNSAIVSGMLLALLAWGQTRRSRLFFTAFALLALGLGNHTTIVGFVPGMVLYALLTDWRFVMRLRTLVTVAGILVAGMCQYAFILIRSRQPGAYIEFPSRATTLGELFDVVRGREFAGALFVFDWRTVLFDNVPRLFSTVLASELTLPGILMASAGALLLLRRRLAVGLLLLLGGGAVFGFTVNYSWPELGVLLIPAILVLWLVAAVGAEATVRLAARRAPWAPTMAALVTLGAPLWLLGHNFAANDLSHEAEAASYFDYVFGALPNRSVVLRENWYVDHMVNYKLLGDGSATGRSIQLASQADVKGLRELSAAGFKIFGFPNSMRMLGWQALDFDFVPYTPPGDRLPQFLARLPNGIVVAIAVPALHAERLAAQGGRLFESIGGPADLAGRTQSNIAIVGARGARRGALEQIRDRGVTLNAFPATGIGTSGVALPVFIQVRADAGEAAIRVGPRDVVRTTEGAVMVLLSPEGRVQQAFVLQASENFRVPAVMRSLSLHALRGSRTVQQLTAHEWTDIGPDVATGSLMVKVAPGTTVLCYVGDDEPLWPRMVDYSSESISVEITPVGRLTSTPQDTSQLDAVDGSGLAQKYAYAIRMTAPPSAPGPISVQLALGGIPARATARVQPPEAAVGAEIFSVNTEGLLRRPDPATEILAMHRDDQSQLLGPGWSDAEVDQTGVYRRTTMPRASAVMPLARDARWIRLQALFLKSDPSENSRIRLRLNGTDLPWQQLDEGWQPYEWTLGPGLLRKGTNEMTLVVERMGEPQPAGDHPIPSRSVAIAEIVVGHNAR